MCRHARNVAMLLPFVPCCCCRCSQFAGAICVVINNDNGVDISACIQSIITHFVWHVSDWFYSFHSQHLFQLMVYFSGKRVHMCTTLNRCGKLCLVVLVFQFARIRTFDYIWLCFVLSIFLSLVRSLICYIRDQVSNVDDMQDGYCSGDDSCRPGSFCSKGALAGTGEHAPSLIVQSVLACFFRLFFQSIRMMGRGSAGNRGAGNRAAGNWETGNRTPGNGETGYRAAAGSWELGFRAAEKRATGHRAAGNREAGNRATAGNRELGVRTGGPECRELKN